jgi:hypothetical protein
VAYLDADDMYTSTPKTDLIQMMKEEIRPDTNNERRNQTGYK